MGGPTPLPPETPATLAASEPRREKAPYKERSSALGSYQPGLDGMRAVAMMVMLGYHAQMPWTRGAFLGLSQFFTLSGFLITALLLRSYQRDGTVRLRSFWVRRIRRLMPASYLTLLGVMVFGATVATRQQAEELPGQVAAAATWTANWFFIATDKSYIDLFAAPSPVQHYWSLAIEEQFYLFMPLVLLVVLGRTRSTKVLAGVFGGAAIASTAWMIHLYDSGAGLDRLYYGTDTRLAELAVGACLAVVLTHIGFDFGERTRRVLAALGVVAFAVTVWGWVNIPLADGFIWRGGYFGFSLVSCAVILGVLSGRGPLVLLSKGPLPWIGRLTYGLFLYHWPIYLWLTEERTGLDQWPLFALRLAVTFGVATLSLVFVERPILHGATLGTPRRLRIALIPAAAAVIVAGTFVAVDREAADPFETLRADDASLRMPVAAGDGVLGVLAVVDDANRPVVERLAELVDDDPSVELVVADGFACRGGLVDVEGGRTCANWASTWPDLVEEHDPDAVLLFVDDWAGDDLDALAEAEGTSPTDLASEALSSGFDLLTVREAPVVWASSTVPFDAALVRSFRPFQQAMGIIEPERTDLFKLLGARLPDRQEVDGDEFLDRSAAVLLADVALYQRADRGDLPRVMVLGDSQSRSLGYGLERWAAENDRALVWNLAIEGCGIPVDGLVRGFGAPERVPERCRVAAEAWSDQIEAFAPDVVVVLSSIWDLQDRQLDGWSGFRSIGDPEFDEFLLQEYVAAVDTFSAGGAQVVWLQPPCTQYRPVQGQSIDLPDSFAAERTRRLNTEVIPELERRRPDQVALFDLFAVLCPDGEYVASMDGVSDLRSDGIHFSVDGALWFAEAHGDALLAAGGLGRTA